MFEKTSVNTFNKNNLLVKKLQALKETYKKSRNQSRAALWAACCCGRGSASVSGVVEAPFHNW